MIDDIKHKNSLLQSMGSEYFNEDVPSHALFDNVQRSELEKTIYAINPLTGFPDSDIGIMNNSTISPTLRQAIQNINHSVEPTAPSSFDDDALLDSVQQPFESKFSYYDRLKQESDEYINSKRNSKEE